jgi:hypothetical protein
MSTNHHSSRYKLTACILAVLLLVAGLLLLARLSGTVFVPYPVAASAADTPVSTEYRYVVH